MDGAIVTPSFANSPRMRQCPHSFSFARRTTSRRCPGRSADGVACACSCRTCWRPAQHRVFVSEHQQLSILRQVSAGDEDNQAERSANQQVDDLKQHPASQPSPPGWGEDTGQPHDPIFGRHRLYQSVTRRALNQITRTRATSSFDVPGDIAGPGGHPAAMVERNQTVGEVAAAITALPPSQRRAIVLHHREGLPNDDIADITASTVPAVRGHLIRGRRTPTRTLAAWRQTQKPHPDNGTFPGFVSRMRERCPTSPMRWPLRR